MTEQPFISVIVPVYNAAQHLRQCLAAIIASSYVPYEVIVVDDGSTDNSAEIARKQGAIVLQLPHQSGPRPSGQDPGVQSVRRAGGGSLGSLHHR